MTSSSERSERLSQSSIPNRVGNKTGELAGEETTEFQSTNEGLK